MTGPRKQRRGITRGRSSGLEQPRFAHLPFVALAAHRATRENVGALGVPPCLITSAVPSQLLPTKSTGTTPLGLLAGAAVAGDANATATLAAKSAAIRIARVFLPTGIPDARTLPAPNTQLDAALTLPRDAKLGPDTTVPRNHALASSGCVSSTASRPPPRNASSAGLTTSG